MANPAGLIEQASQLSRQLMIIRRDIRELREEIEDLGVDGLLDKAQFYDSEGNLIRNFTPDQFKDALGSVEAFDVFMIEHQKTFRKIAS